MLALMETRALRYFQAVAELGSYSRASEQLRISQPAVSRQIAKLEQELETALFKRHGHGVTLTDAGRILLERSQLALRQLDQTKSEIRGGKRGPAGAISVALPPAAGYFLAPALVRRFNAEYPNVFLRIVGGFSSYIHEWLTRGQVDLACVHDPLPQRGFESTPLVKEEVYLVGRRTGGLPLRDHVRVAELPGIPLILPSRPNASRRVVDGWSADAGIALNVKLEVDDHSMLRGLLRQGLGFTLLTRSALDSDLRQDDVHAWRFRPRAYWQLTLVRPAHGRKSDLAEAFVRTLRDVARDLSRTGVWAGRSVDRG
jgi:LysR family nitrogen assimilation transcriptional regulator